MPIRRALSELAEDERASMVEGLDVADGVAVVD
jgi:hypothetical protein